MLIVIIVTMYLTMSFHCLFKETQNLCMTDAELTRMGVITKILKETSRYHSSKFAEVDISLLLRLLKSWPVSMIFPGEFPKYSS